MAKKHDVKVTHRSCQSWIEPLVVVSRSEQQSTSACGDTIERVQKTRERQGVGVLGYGDGRNRSGCRCGRCCGRGNARGFSVSGRRLGECSIEV